MRSAAILVPVLLLAQAGATRWAASAESPPEPPSLEAVPKQFSGWRDIADETLEPQVIRELQADRILNRLYVRTDGIRANLFVAWFQTQSRGARQPHSPQVCLPGAGWTPVIADRVSVDTGPAQIQTNRYVASLGGELAVILYWYQTPRRAVASEWASKFWTVWDAITVRRTDIAMIRVVTWPQRKGDYPAATKNAMNFAAKMYPALKSAMGW